MVFREFPELLTKDQMTTRSNSITTFIGFTKRVQEHTEEAITEKKEKYGGGVKSENFPNGEMSRMWLQGGGTAVNQEEFPYCCNERCRHKFIDFIPFSNDDEEHNTQAWNSYTLLSRELELWKKKVGPQPTCPNTGKNLTKIPAPKMKKRYIRCHCKQMKVLVRRGNTCKNPQSRSYPLSREMPCVPVLMQHARVRAGLPQPLCGQLP